MSDDNDKSISLPLANTEEAGGEGQPKSRDEGGDIQSEIQKEVTDHKIVLYMKGNPAQPMCGFSARAAAIIDAYGKQFHAVDILQDQEKRQGIKEFSNWPTIPQVYIDGEFVGGSDILMEMHENGELAPLVEAAFAE